MSSTPNQTKPNCINEQMMKKTDDQFPCLKMSIGVKQSVTVYGSVDQFSFSKFWVQKFKK